MRAFLSTSVVRWLGALLAVALIGAGTGAPGALARTRHHHHHRRTAVCYARRHHRRHRTRCSTRRSTKHSAHGRGVSGQSSPAPAATNQSNNWSGYGQGTLEQGGTLFHSIGAQWTVPNATQHTKGQAEYSSDWIGIGGGCIDSGCTATDSTLIQAGTEQDVSSSGGSSYSVWWEVIPGPSLTVTSMSIHPGDRIAASIAETIPNSEVWTISIKDLTNGQSYGTTVPYSSSHGSAEWIQETPVVLGSDSVFAAQPNLTSPAFNFATTNGAPAKLNSSERIELIDSSGHAIGTPSNPDPDADGFNVCAWASACAAPSSG